MGRCLGFYIAGAMLRDMGLWVCGFVGVFGGGAWGGKGGGGGGVGGFGFWHRIAFLPVGVRAWGDVR